MAEDVKMFLPALLRDLADALGLPAALRLASEFGGDKLYLPAEADPEHQIAKRCGIDVLRWLLDTYRGGEAVLVPLGPLSPYNKRIAYIRNALIAGEKGSTIIRAAGCHERTVRRHRKTLRGRQGDDKQGKLL